MLGPVIDIFRMRQYFNAITVARDFATGVVDDAAFLFDARRALLPLPFEDRGDARAVLGRCSSGSGRTRSSP